jgi:hypothetical protein
MSTAAPAALGGRAAALARRQALSAGKSALPPAQERVRTGQRTAALAVPATAPAAAAVQAPATPDPYPEDSRIDGAIGLASSSGRQAALARRRALAAGKAALPPATERVRGDERARSGALAYAPKVVPTATQGGQRVTGLRIGRGDQVTGDEPGATLPVSGTQYIGGEGGVGARPAAPKVGLARTDGGIVVSGTLVRSRVAVTGDEAGATIMITGERDQRLEDDLTPRAGEGAWTGAQFQRQADPHGQSVSGTNLGRSVRWVGSRDRARRTALESTEHGQPITGSAIGRATRVTGDEQGACRQVTGDQYLSPARAQSECGGRGGGTAPAAHTGAVRRDPVTGAKVSQALTWRRQSVSGPNVEHDPHVTGDAPGSCSTITGTPYQGPLTMHGWCDPADAAAAEKRLVKPAGSVASVTGDTPCHDAHVTGIARGAAQSISGTPYYRDAGQVACPGDVPVGLIDGRFSVHSPQRSAQLRAAATAAAASVGGQPASAAGGAERITGTFAAGQDKITGNLEFSFRPRAATESGTAPARSRLTGEGRSSGQRITGSAWTEQANVTGTEGHFAADRNASERAGKPQSFSGARRFKVETKDAQPRQLVTGMVGWSPRQGARVTLSGGAQG